MRAAAVIRQRQPHEAVAAILNPYSHTCAVQQYREPANDRDGSKADITAPSFSPSMTLAREARTFAPTVTDKDAERGNP